MAKKTDPCELAYNLIHDGNVQGRLTELVAKIEAARVEAVEQCRGLQAVGSHKISAPDLMAGNLLAKIKDLGTFVGNCIEQIENIKADQPTGLE